MTGTTRSTPARRQSAASRAAARNAASDPAKIPAALRSVPDADKSATGRTPLTPTVTNTVGSGGSPTASNDVKILSPAEKAVAAEARAKAAGAKTTPAPAPAETPKPKASTAPTATVEAVAHTRWNGTATVEGELIRCDHSSRNGHITLDAGTRCGEKLARAVGGTAGTETRSRYQGRATSIADPTKSFDCSCGFGHKAEDTARECAGKLARANGLKV